MGIDCNVPSGRSPLPACPRKKELLALVPSLQGNRGEDWPPRMVGVLNRRHYRPPKLLIIRVPGYRKAQFSRNFPAHGGCVSPLKGDFECNGLLTSWDRSSQPADARATVLVCIVVAVPYWASRPRCELTKAKSVRYVFLCLARGVLISQ